MPRLIANITRSFSAAHHIEVGRCANNHGHNFKIVASFELVTNQSTSLESKVENYVTKNLDHQDLNSSFCAEPTMEVLAAKIFSDLSEMGKLAKLILQETENNSVEILK